MAARTDLPLRSRASPRGNRVVTALVSKAPRDRDICQGKMAIKNAAVSPIVHFFLGNSSYPRKNMVIIPKPPRTALGRRTANSFRPKNFTEGTVKNAYRG